MSKTDILQAAQVAPIVPLRPADPEDEPIYSWDDPLSWVEASETTPPPPLPLDVFGAFWQDWIQRTADLKGCPADFIACSLLAATAGLIGNHVSGSPREGWEEPTILWMALVGNPSSGKSPARDGVMDLLQVLQAEIQEDYPEAVRKAQEKREIAKVAEEKWLTDLKKAISDTKARPPKPADAEEPPEAAYPLLYLGDATPEYAAKALLDNPRGLLASWDELTGFITSMDRYGSEGSGRGFWLASYGGREYSIGRIKNAKRNATIPRLSISALGGIQPDRVESLLFKGDDDGLTARYLFCWPGKRKFEMPTTRVDNRREIDALRRIRDIQPKTDERGNLTPHVLRMEDAAKEPFTIANQWLIDQEDAASGRFVGHLGKLRTYLVRLATVLELLWWSERPQEGKLPACLSRQAVESAITLVVHYFYQMSLRVYGRAGLSATESQAMALIKGLLDLAKEEGRARFNLRADILRPRLAGIRKADELTEPLLCLQRNGWIQPVFTRAGNKPGRQAKNYELNPQILQEANP